MAIPSDSDIQEELLRTLAGAPDGCMHCRDLYKRLAKRFPTLSKEELEEPYRTSVSHFSNRVQWARQHLVQKGYLYRPDMSSGRGYWKLTPKGREAWVDEETRTAEAFAQLDSLLGARTGDGGAE